MTDTTIFAIAFAVVVVLLSFVYLFIRSRTASGRAVLICGLSESGKTLVFSRLVAEKTVDTYTSMKENSSMLQIPKKKPIQLVDVPGNDRQRLKFFDDLKGRSRGVLFCVDSSTITKDAVDVAEWLYYIISDSYASRLPLAILCNKQDQPLAKGCQPIQRTLEKELQLIKSTRDTHLASTEAGSTRTSGKKGKGAASTISLSDAIFLEFSAKQPTPDHLKNLQAWLVKVA